MPILSIYTLWIKGDKFTMVFSFLDYPIYNVKSDPYVTVMVISIYQFG